MIKLCLLLSFLLLWPIVAEAQGGYSTDSLGNLVPEKIGVMKDARGVEYYPATGALQSAAKQLCPLAEIGLKLGAVALIVIGMVQMLKGAKEGGFSGHSWRHGVIMFIVAGAIFSLPNILSMMGLDYLSSRADNANIWSCLWS